MRFSTPRHAEATESVRDGKRLSEPLSIGGFIPEQILAMITVAEESNNLDKVLVQIADTVERRTNRQVDQAVRLMIFLLVPEAATQKHLEILSEIAELLSDAALRDKLNASTDAVQLHTLISHWKPTPSS